ncbi:MAG TPA: 30S ribosomal protein S2 [Candidatus Paceibacterota bacterium]
MTEDQTVAKIEEIFADPAFKDMVEAGVYYGRKKSKTHPRMKQFTLGNRNGIEMINLIKTKELLDEALKVIEDRVKNGGNLLIVATQPQAEGVVALAGEFGFPVVNKRWLGGTLTNSRIILTRIDHFKKLRNDLAQGLLEKYTKKERLGFEKEVNKTKELLGGLESYDGRPALMLVIDPNMHMTAVREARHMRVPVVGFSNTDVDPDMVDYLVLGNNKARAGVNWFLDKIKEAVKSGIAQRAVVKPAEEKVESPANKK